MKFAYASTNDRMVALDFLDSSSLLVMFQTTGGFYYGKYSTGPHSRTFANKFTLSGSSGKNNAVTIV